MKTPIDLQGPAQRLHTVEQAGGSLRLPNATGRSPIEARLVGTLGRRHRQRGTWLHPFPDNAHD